MFGKPFTYDYIPLAWVGISCWPLEPPTSSAWNTKNGLYTTSADVLSQHYRSSVPACSITNIIFHYGGGLFLTRSIFIFLCFLFFLIWWIFSMWLCTSLKDAFRHQASILPCRWCFLHGSLHGFTNDCDWIRCVQSIFYIIGIPIYVFVKVPRQGIKWVGSSLCVFN